MAYVYHLCFYDFMVNNLDWAQQGQLVFTLYGVGWAHLCICSQLIYGLEDAGLRWANSHFLE